MSEEIGDACDSMSGSESEYSNQAVNTMKILPERTTRGKRMNELVGEEVEKDDQFWKNLGVNGEADEDASYSEDSEEEDEVDSDFDMPEISENEQMANHETDDISIKRKRRFREFGLSQHSKIVKLQKIKIMEGEKNIGKNNEKGIIVRDYTVQKTLETQKRFEQWEKKQEEREFKKKNEIKKEEPKKTHLDLMREAAHVESLNMEYLKYMQLHEKEKNEITGFRKQVNINDLLTYHLKLVNGKPKTSIQYNKEGLLSKLKSKSGPKKINDLINSKFTLSQENSKYCEPTFMVGYKGIESYKILRERLFQQEDEKIVQRIQALNELLSIKKDKIGKEKYISTQNAGAELSKQGNNDPQNIGNLNKEEENELS